MVACDKDGEITVGKFKSDRWSSVLGHYLLAFHLRRSRRALVEVEEPYKGGGELTRN